MVEVKAHERELPELDVSHPLKWHTFRLASSQEGRFDISLFCREPLDESVKCFCTIIDDSGSLGKSEVCRALFVASFKNCHFALSG